MHRIDQEIFKLGLLYLPEHMRGFTEEHFAALLEQTYQQLTGAPLTRRDPVFVERYNHGGMSGGYVSPQFWVETAIPLLRARYRDTE